MDCAYKMQQQHEKDGTAFFNFNLAMTLPDRVKNDKTYVDNHKRTYTSAGNVSETKARA